MTETSATRSLLASLHRRARFGFVDVALWGLRAAVVAVVAAGTAGTLVKGRYGLADWLDFLAYGVTMGSVYSLIALGYTMVYGVLRLINFAHGDIMMTGAFSGYFLAAYFDETGFLGREPAIAMLAVLALGVATSTTIALLTERLAYRPFRRVRGFTPLICAIGVSFFLEQSFRGAFGSGVHAYPDTKWQNETVSVFGFGIPVVQIIVVAIALASMTILYLIVQRTRMGAAMRAVSEDRRRRADGDRRRQSHRLHFRPRRRDGRGRGRLLRLRVQAGLFLHGLHAGRQGVRRGGARRHRQRPRRDAGRTVPRNRRIRGARALPRRDRHSRALPAARPHRVHLAHHGADFSPVRDHGRAHGEEASVSAVATMPAGARGRRAPLKDALKVGLVFGAVAVYIAVVGILPMFDKRWIVVGVVSLGQAALIAIALGAGAATVLRSPALKPLSAAAAGLVAGGVAGLLLALLALAMQNLPLRRIFIALSPILLRTLTFGLGAPLGGPILIAAAAVLGAIGAAMALAPPRVRDPLLIGLAFVVVFGVFQELIQIILQSNPAADAVRQAFYSWEGLEPGGAAAIFLLASAGAALWMAAPRAGLGGAVAGLSLRRQSQARALQALGLVALLVLMPVLAGSYIGQVMLLVGLYMLMGTGLNLEVGLAGLLDLGFVAFFAVGAYATALLTADSSHALASYTPLPSLSFWAAAPIAVLASVVVGVLFGIPVLGVRGDYLAVATMGLGEIVRVIVQSDMAAPVLGGAQGILQIPKPRVGAFELADPVDLFYLTLIASGFAAYCAWRLENSRLGRAWMAVRDDEDVAQALGVNLVEVKLLAYGLGAAFAGLAGSIFAVMLTSVYPSSFQLLVSINVLALIIVGGLGSLPGVVVGAVALVGLPELLREFGEYRYLFYGVALIAMMRFKPEGLWPSPVRRRELRAAAAATAGERAEP